MYLATQNSCSRIVMHTRELAMVAAKLVIHATISVGGIQVECRVEKILRSNLAGCHHTDTTECVTEDCEPVAQTTVSLGELLPPVVEVSGLVEEKDTKEGSFKKQYGQEGSQLSISSSHLGLYMSGKSVSGLFS